MKKTTIPGAMLALLTVGALPAAAITGVPSLDLSTVECAYEGDEILSLYVLPDGSGQNLSQALLPNDPDGGPLVTTDATITLTLRDSAGYPIVYFPAEDLWIESSNGGMARCPGGSIAEANTDYDGQTRWSGSFRAGGWSTGSLQVYVNGSPVTDGAVAIRVNSPDIDGNLSVDLADVAVFASHYFGFDHYDYSCDYNFDGALNLSDIALLANGVGTVCP